MNKIFFVFTLMSMFVSHSQEFTLPVANQYLADSEFLVSPTYAGIGNFVKVRFSGVTQWVGIKDSPDYQSISADMRIADRSGVGFVLYNDKNGYTKQKGAKLSYAHHLVLDGYENHYISLGLSYLLNNFSIDTEKFDISSVQDFGVNGNRSLLNHNFEAGLLYRYKGLFASLSFVNILDKNTVFSINEPIGLRNYNLYTGYRYRKTFRSVLEIEPSLFVQFYESDRRSSTDLNLKLRWFDLEDYFWSGLSFRFLNDQIFSPLSMSAMFGFKKQIFYFAYGYQLNINKLVGYNAGTHMITLGVDLFQGLGGCKCLIR